MQEQEIHLSDLLKPKDKITLVYLSPSIMSAVVKSKLVVREVNVPHNGKRIVAVAESSRHRKMTSLEGTIANIISNGGKGAFILRGHEDGEFYAEGEVSQGSVRRSLWDGTFRISHPTLAASPETYRKIVDNIRSRLVFNNCDVLRHIRFVDKASAQDGSEAKVSFIPSELTDDLPRHVLREWNSKPAPAFHKSPFTDAQMDKLIELAKQEDMYGVAPAFKLFKPGTACTWLVYGADPDRDTLYVVADIGMDCVESGTLSLKEICQVMPRTLAPELDRHYDPKKMAYTIGELFRMSSLPADLHHKPKESAAC